MNNRLQDDTVDMNKYHAIRDLMTAMFPVEETKYVFDIFYSLDSKRIIPEDIRKKTKTFEDAVLQTLSNDEIFFLMQYIQGAMNIIKRTEKK